MKKENSVEDTCLGCESLLYAGRQTGEINSKRGCRCVVKECFITVIANQIELIEAVLRRYAAILIHLYLFPDVMDCRPLHTFSGVVLPRQIEAYPCPVSKQLMVKTPWIYPKFIEVFLEKRVPSEITDWLA